MSLSESAHGPLLGGGGHEAKTEKICRVIRECCSGMSAADKQTMMREVMPHMMETMGDSSMRGAMAMMMGHCLQAFRWLPLIPLFVGALLLLLGYFLSPEVVRILWFALAALPVVLGALGLLMTTVMSR